MIVCKLCTNQDLHHSIMVLCDLVSVVKTLRCTEVKIKLSRLLNQSIPSDFQLFNYQNCVSSKIGIYTRFALDIGLV